MSRRLYQLSYRPTKEANYSRKAASWSSPSGGGPGPWPPGRSAFGRERGIGEEEAELARIRSNRRGAGAPGGAGRGRRGPPVVGSCTMEDQAADDAAGKTTVPVPQPGHAPPPEAAGPSSGSRPHKKAGLPVHADSPVNRQVSQRSATWRRQR